VYTAKNGNILLLMGSFYLFIFTQLALAFTNIIAQRGQNTVHKPPIMRLWPLSDMCIWAPFFGARGYSEYKSGGYLEL
jgi:hypothetical protein